MDTEESRLDQKKTAAAKLARGKGSQHLQSAEPARREDAHASQRETLPASFEAHAHLMYDLQVLAYQADLTRVITFMVGREFSGRTYPEIGAPDAHHPTSHHQNDPEKLDKLTKINTYHTTQFAYYLDKLKRTPDGDGSLLDHTMLVYGAGMSDGNAHSPANLPILLVGGGGQVKGGRHLKFPSDTPVSNLHVTLLGKLGVDVERLAGSTGPLPELSL